MSEEKFNSRPPSLPMPSTISGTSSPCALRGLPNTGSQMRARRRRRRPNARIREIRHGMQGLRHAGTPGDVAPRDAQHFAAPPLAQDAQRLRRGRLPPDACFIFRARDARRGGLVMAAQPLERRRILDQYRGDELAAGGGARQFRTQLRLERRVAVEKCRLARRVPTNGPAARATLAERRRNPP